MSGYRSYVPWNKTSSSSSAVSLSPASSSYASGKKDAGAPTSKYESTYSKSRPDAKKTASDKSVTPSSSGASSADTKYATKSNPTYGSESTGYQRLYDSRTDLTAKVKSPVEKKENHPPVAYRPIIRTPGTRSRDPSPVLDRDPKSATDASYNFNRLYPRPYTGGCSMSRERTDSVASTGSTTTIPKYTGRSSINKDDFSTPKSYLGRTSRNASREDLSLAKYKPPETKQDLLTARFKSKEDLTTTSKYKSPTNSTSTSASSSGRELAKYQTPSRATSREDLSKGPQKFITSRFLPKNTIEKSHTAYLRTSTARTSEVSRKNRELLNTLSANSDRSSSRPSISRSSFIVPEDVKPATIENASLISRPELTKAPPAQVQKQLEIETVTVVTRSTSPNPPSAQNSYIRTRRADVARVIEKQISRTKYKGEMIDKCIQSDRLDDSTKSSRFSGASRISAAPWSSFLDLKYSSPNTSSSELPNTEATDHKKDTKNISRNNSSKSISKSSSKSDLRRSRSNSSQSISDSGQSPKVKPSPPKTIKLPPSEKNENAPSMLHSLNTPNKDFRKSVLNMNPENQKFSKRSNSASSADSESAEGDSKTKLPQRVSSGGVDRGRRSQSTSSERSSSSKSSDDETKLHSIRLQSPDATSAILSSADELSLDKPKLSKALKVEKDHEAKSFLMRALAPVTNFFKVKQPDTSQSECSDRTSRNIPDLLLSSTADDKRPILRQIKAADRSWWFEDGGEETRSRNGGSCKILRHVESGELAWWLDDRSEVPQGVEVFPATSYGEDGRTEDGRLVYKLRNDSEDHSWFLDSSSDATDKNISDIPNSTSEERRPLRLIQHANSNEKSWWLEAETRSSSSGSKGRVRRIQHVKSGERAWWLDDNVEVPDGVMVYPATSTDAHGITKEGKIIYKLRRTDSTELEWWLTTSESSKSSQIQNQGPQGLSITDSAEPEFLQKYKIRHIDSGERAWWMCSNENICEASTPNEHKWKARPEEEEFDHEEAPLGDRASPEGLETPREEYEAGKLSPYDNVPIFSIAKGRKDHAKVKAMFISKHTNIDDILGGSSQLLSPFIDRIFSYQSSSTTTEFDEVDANPVKLHDGNSKRLLQNKKSDGRFSAPRDYTQKFPGELSLMKA